MKFNGFRSFSDRFAVVLVFLIFLVPQISYAQEKVENSCNKKNFNIFMTSGIKKAYNDGQLTIEQTIIYTYLMKWKDLWPLVPKEFFDDHFFEILNQKSSNFDTSRISDFYNNYSSRLSSCGIELWKFDSKLEDYLKRYNFLEPDEKDQIYNYLINTIETINNKAIKKFGKNNKYLINIIDFKSQLLTYNKTTGETNSPSPLPGSSSISPSSMPTEGR